MVKPKSIIHGVKVFILLIIMFSAFLLFAKILFIFLNFINSAVAEELTIPRYQILGNFY